MRHLLARILLVVLAVAILSASAATIPANAGQERQYLVAGKKDALPDRSAVAASGGIWVDQISSIGVAVVRSSDSDFLARVRGKESVALASPDFQAVIPATELDAEEKADLAAAAATLAPEDRQAAGDPFYDLQWAHRAMGVDLAQANGITGSGVRVAVVDSGIDCLHEDLRSNCLPGKSFVPLPDGSGFEDPWDATDPHGTQVAGIIAATANNGRGVRGVAPEASLISVKVAPASGEGFPWSRIATAYDWASGDGQADLINASHVVTLSDSDPASRKDISDFLGIANRLAALVFRRGVAIFAAAGNGAIDVAAATDLKLWPAEYAPGAVTIGATAPCGAALDGNVLNDYYDNRASYSNYGFDPNESRFLVFPGGDNQCARQLLCRVGALTLPCRFFDQIVTTAPRGTGLNGYTVFMGTSASTPHATGLAALILSRYPDMKVGTLVDTILNTATDLGDPGYDGLFGYGRGSASWLK
jgi:lantibiotic leader peptide-processing serine protease